jgi:hypothetical protein
MESKELTEIDGQYTGELNEKKERQGRGLLIFSESIDYEAGSAAKLGNIKDWEMYQGEFKDNQITGTGVLFLRDGSKFEGDFENSKIKHGMLTLANED